MFAFSRWSVKNKLLALFLMLNLITVTAYSVYGFILKSQGVVAEIDSPPQRGHLLARHAFRPADLPTVMRKAFDLAHSSILARDSVGG